MRKDIFTAEELMERWEDRRAIKNLMGKYANCVILNREQDIFDLFWSERSDICLGFNAGWYTGRADVAGYYQAMYAGNCLKAKIMQEIFPQHLGTLSDEELYGVGPFKVRPIGSQIIEIAEDGQTAKGIWHCQGAYAEIEAAGPVSYWTWGYYCVDFIKEGEDWKIWHLLYVNDVDSPCGQSWGKPIQHFPERPEFAAVKAWKLPEPTVPGPLWSYYHPRRPHTPPPRLPEEYDTFSNTFSYGI